jgi:hypothetical protein
LPSIAQVREGNAHFDLTYPDTIPELYVDGVAQALVGYPLSKIVLFTVVPIQGAPVEQRRVVQQVVINTATLLEFCRNVLAGALQNQQSMGEVTTNFESQFRAMLEGLTVPAAPGANITSRPPGPPASG